jgi:FdhD protein
MSIVSHTGIQVRNGRAREIEDRVIREGRFRLYLNGTLYAVMVASDDQLEELGAGFVVCQGLAETVDSVRVDGDAIHVSAPVAGLSGREMSSAGALQTTAPAGKVTSDLTLTVADVFSITGEIETDLWRETGGVHCSILFFQGDILVKSSDVGRHNTVDKVVGHAVLRGVDRSRCVIGCTGRQPRDMVIKYARAGVPVIISRAASTDKGIMAAQEAGITLICFSRDGRFTVYTHPHRIADLGNYMDQKRKSGYGNEENDLQ